MSGQPPVFFKHTDKAKTAKLSSDYDWMDEEPMPLPQQQQQKQGQDWQGQGVLQDPMVAQTR